MKKLISASFKKKWARKLKSKIMTNSQNFCPDPPNNENLKSSVFWMNLTILIIFVFFFKTIFVLVGFLPPTYPSQPARKDKSNHFFIFLEASPYSLSIFHFFLLLCFMLSLKFLKILSYKQAWKLSLNVEDVAKSFLLWKRKQSLPFIC